METWVIILIVILVLFVVLPVILIVLVAKRVGNILKEGSCFTTDKYGKSCSLLEQKPCEDKGGHYFASNYECTNYMNKMA